MTLSQSQDRTEQTLRYASIHIQELQSYENAESNDDWKNAHQESCFFHLAGAMDYLLHEVNDAYSLGLERTEVGWRRVKQALQSAGQHSRAFSHLRTIGEEKGSWLDLLFEWRKHGAHRRHCGKVVWIGRANQFKNPRTSNLPAAFLEAGCQQVLEELVQKVRDLVDHCRSTDSLLHDANVECCKDVARRSSA